MQKRVLLPRLLCPHAWSTRKRGVVHLRTSSLVRITDNALHGIAQDNSWTAPKTHGFYILCAHLQNVHIFDPFFYSRRPITTTWSNCSNRIRTNYVGCDHPSIMQAKVWCFVQRVSDEPMKWMSKIRVFWLYSYLTNEMSIYFNGYPIINYAYMKIKRFWGFGVMHGFQKNQISRSKFSQHHIGYLV